MTEQDKRAVMLTPDEIETLIAVIQREVRALPYRSDLARFDSGVLEGKLNRLYKQLLDQKQ